MSFLGRVKRFFNLSISDPKAWNPLLWNLLGSQSASGETVTEETALTYSAIWNAVAIYSGTISSLPLHLMRPGAKGRGSRKAIEHKLYNIMHMQWNPFMTAMAGRECLVSHALTWGNGYAEIVRNKVDDIIGLWPIPPNRVRPEMEDDKIVYIIHMTDGSDIKLPREKVLHIPGLGFDGFMGYSPIAMFKKSIGLGMAMETFGSRYFGEGTHPSAVVTHPNQLKDPKQMREALSSVYAGLGNTHQLMLLEEGMKIEKVGIPPEDSQFIESRKFQITDVARIYNLPVHKLKEMTKSSFNNIESEQASFVTDSILPWLVRHEQNYHIQLLSPSEQKQGFYFKHIIEGLLRANAKDRAEFYAKMWGSGFMTQNEVREKEDLNPDDNPLADELFVMANMIPLNKIDEFMAKNQGPVSLPQEIEPKEEEPKPITDERMGNLKNLQRRQPNGLV